MIKQILCTVCLWLIGLMAGAQSLTPITWTAYGLTFEAPRGILVEEDTEETFLVNNNKYYILIQSLDSDGMIADDLASFLQDYANDDGVKSQSAITSFDLPQFYGVMLSGLCGEEDNCLYACLLTKDAGSGFYLSITYTKDEKAQAEKILKSFKMEE